MVTRVFTIYTGGPVIDGTASDIRRVKRYVEKHAPLKRGWTGEWIRPKGGPRNNVWIYRRINSKGNHVKGYDIGVVRVDEDRRVRHDRLGYRYVIVDGRPAYVSPCCESFISIDETATFYCKACYEAVDPRLGADPVLREF